MARRLFVMATTICTAMVLTAGLARAQEGSPEQQFVQLINKARAVEGLGALSFDAGLADIARRHTGRMVQAGSIFHNTNLGGEVAANTWSLLGENVGYGPDVEMLDTAFLNSPNHRKNIMGAFDKVGIGVMTNDDGTMYVTEVFMKTAAPKPVAAPKVTRAPAATPRVRQVRAATVARPVATAAPAFGPKFPFGRALFRV